MMNVLSVNENDDVLHQKAHAKDTVLMLFRKLKHATPSTSTDTEIQKKQSTVPPVPQTLLEAAPFQQNQQVPVDNSGHPERPGMLNASDIQISQGKSLSGRASPSCAPRLGAR